MLWYALGNVQISQKKLDVGLASHLNAHWQLSTTAGPTHYLTAQVCYRLAEDYARIKLFEEAEY